MKEVIRKLSSRKLWIAIAGVATGIAMALGVNSSEIESVTGAVTAIVSAVAYILAESKIDAERVKTAVEATQQAVETVKGE